MQNRYNSHSSIDRFKKVRSAFYTPAQQLTSHDAEFTSLVKAVMSKVIESSQLSQQKQFLTDRMIPLLSAATNLHWFGIGGSLVHLAFDEARWSGIVGESFRAEDAKSILECIAKIYEVSFSWRRLY